MAATGAARKGWNLLEGLLVASRRSDPGRRGPRAKPFGLHPLPPSPRTHYFVHFLTTSPPCWCVCPNTTTSPRRDDLGPPAVRACGADHQGHDGAVEDLGTRP